MKTSGTARVVATLFIGVIVGVYLHFREMRILAQGKDAFLAAQARRFDGILSYHSSITMVIAGIILAALAVGLYELIATGFTRLIPPTEIEE